MTLYDCFNGDADGICALTQMRLDQPAESELITGVKRDIKLLSRVQPEAGDKITVLDVSMDKNRKDLERVLECGAEVFYCDHHFAGDIPQSPRLESVINTAANVCTSLLINQRLKGRFLDWAITGTFGDNLKKAALGLAKTGDFSEQEVTLLEELGIYINYNGYGADLDDLYFAPMELFKRTVKYSSALEFIAADHTTYSMLKEGYHADMKAAQSAKTIFEDNRIVVLMLPNESWARRVSGVFGNDLANARPDKAHAVLTEKEDQSFLVSVRAPLERKTGADEVCRQFDTGGGRAAAAGINRLVDEDLDRFVRTMKEFYK